MRKTTPWTLALIGSAMLAGSAFAAAPQGPSLTPATAITRNTAVVQMVVKHAYAHLRKAPTTKSAILAKLKKGTKVEVIEKVAHGKWAHVKVGKLEGYIALSLLG